MTRFLRNIDPFTIFKLDAVGAFITAFMHGIVLVYLQSHFGIPKEILKFLALIAGIYAIYSAACSFFKPKNWRLFLRIIAIANLLFCLFHKLLFELLNCIRVLLQQCLAVVGRWQG